MIKNKHKTRKSYCVKARSIPPPPHNRFVLVWAGEGVYTILAGGRGIPLDLGAVKRYPSSPLPRKGHGTIDWGTPRKDLGPEAGDQ